MASKDLLSTPSIKGIKAATTGAVPLGRPISGVQQPHVVSAGWIKGMYAADSHMQSYGGIANADNATWPTAPGPYVEWKISHPGGPLGNLSLVFTVLTGPNIGKFTMTADGINPVTYDLYSVPYLIVIRTYDVLPLNADIHKEPSVHTFRATLIEKNPSSSGQIVLFYSLQLFAYGTPTV